MCVYCNRSQMTSQRVKNNNHVTRLRLVSFFLFFARCDIICDLLQYTHMEKCNLFYKYKHINSMRDLVRLASRVWGTKRWQRPSSAGLWPEAPAGRGDYCDIIWHGVSPTISHRLETYDIGQEKLLHKPSM